jgi:hypothetical protein
MRTATIYGRSVLVNQSPHYARCIIAKSIKIMRTNFSTRCEVISTGNVFGNVPDS